MWAVESPVVESWVVEDWAVGSRVVARVDSSFAVDKAALD